ncbi:MAG: hypothetical protein HYU64_17145 [Armatimonadetes bacterium]|nr:hypothetical protein [Armatimonadota bacterium]
MAHEKTTASYPTTPLKQRGFASAPTPRFLLLSLLPLSVGSLLLYYGIAFRKLLEFMAYFPILMGAAILLVWAGALVIFLGKEVVLTPKSITLKQGARSDTVFWETLSEFREKEMRFLLLRINRTMWIGDGKTSFEIHELFHPKYDLIREVVNRARQARQKDQTIRV